jgi:cyclopropane fatty-acyl-phospholipid synthase-like methyltransferase
MRAMNKLLSDRFPRSNAYHPDWVIGRGSGGANALWLTEWLAEELALSPGMRVLDLGCGRAMSSVFLHREFGVQVWAADLWFSALDNWQCIRDAGAAGGVFPIHAEAHALPFAPEFFDAIVSIDSYHYYGTGDTYTPYVSTFLKPGGTLAIASAGLTREFEGEVPPALAGWWEPNMASLHTAAWWQRHWQRSGILEVSQADSLEGAWQLWLQWHETAFPDNRGEIEALQRDRGEHLTYVRAIARRKAGIVLPEPLTQVPTVYTPHPLLRGQP